MTENEEPITEEPEVMDDTDVIIDQDKVKVIETPIYEFTITQRLDPDYGMATKILNWLHDNMASLKDDYNKTIFGKVNFGFNENIIKTFGKKPVCDVYIKNVDYTGVFENHLPNSVDSIVIIYFKGANNKTYLKATELHDLVMQEFVTNPSFKELEDVVRETVITNSTIQNRTIRGGYGVMCTFELTHNLYW